MDSNTISRKSIKEAYESSDVTIFCADTHNERGKAAFEALAQGVPEVRALSRMPSLPRFVLVLLAAGQNGCMVVASRDEEELRRGMRFIYSVLPRYGETSSWVCFPDAMGLRINREFNGFKVVQGGKP